MSLATYKGQYDKICSMQVLFEGRELTNFALNVSLSQKTLTPIS